MQQEVEFIQRFRILPKNLLKKLLISLSCKCIVSPVTSQIWTTVGQSKCHHNLPCSVWLASCCSVSVSWSHKVFVEESFESNPCQSFESSVCFTLSFAFSFTACWSFPSKRFICSVALLNLTCWIHIKRYASVIRNPDDDQNNSWYRKTMIHAYKLTSHLSQFNLLHQNICNTKGNWAMPYTVSLWI